MYRYKHANRVHHQGYTLIEILLVVGLLSAITVAGLSFYRQKTLNLKIARTSLQLQQWLQAGQAFYVQKGHWPTSVEREELLQHYLPTQSESNAWGYSFEIEEGSSGNLFRVQTQVPSTYLNPNTQNSAIAERLAARLPNAAVEEVNSVYTEVNTPGYISALANQVTLVRIEQVTVSDTAHPAIIKPSEEQCETRNHLSKLYLTLDQFDFNRANGKGLGWLLNDTRIAFTEDEHAWYPSFKAQVYQRNLQSRTARLTAIITCEPKPDEQLWRGQQRDNQHYIF